MKLRNLVQHPSEREPIDNTEKIGVIGILHLIQPISRHLRAMILLSIGSHSTFPAAVHNLGRVVLGTLWEVNKSTDRLILGAQPHYG